MRKEILNAIEHDSRIDLNDLASMLGTSLENVKGEIAKMENEQVICGYHTLINWDKVSDEKVTALIEVKVTPQRGYGFDKIAERIYNFEEVNAVYLISGSYDFTVLIEGKSMKEVSKFVFEKLSTVESVIGTATHFVLKKYKDHGTVLDNPKKKDERLVIMP